MAFIVLGTSVCFAVDRHICEGEVWSVSYFGSADVCEKMQHGQETEVMSCCLNKATTEKSSDNSSQIKKVPCCSQETFINSSLDGKEQPSSSDFNIQLIATHLDLSNSGLFSLSAVEGRFHDTRPPPDCRRDFQSLFQVFII